MRLQALERRDYNRRMATISEKKAEIDRKCRVILYLLFGVLGMLSIVVVLITRTGLSRHVSKSTFMGILLVAGVLVVGLLLAHAILRRHLPPADPRRRAAKAYYDALDESGRSAIRKIQFLTKGLLFAGVVGWFWMDLTDGMHKLSWIILAGHHPDSVHFVADYGVTSLAGMVVVISGPVMLMFGLIPMLRGTGASHWRQYMNAHCGIERSRKLLGLSFGMAFALSVMVLVLFLGSYMRVTTKGVAISRFTGSGETFYSWRSVTNLRDMQYRQSKSKRIIHRYSISFADGRSWSPRLSNLDLTRRLGSALEYVSERTGKPIEVLTRD